MRVVDSVRREAHALLGGGKGRILVPVAVGWGLVVGTRMTYPVLLPYLREAFAFGLPTAGLLVTLLWLASSLGQLPSGILTDRYGERWLLTVSTSAVAAALVLAALATSRRLLFAATVLIGLGISMYPIARISILMDTYPDRIGSALGVTMATGDLGQTLLPPAVGLVAGWASWYLGFGFVVPFLLAMVVVLRLSLPATSSGATTATDGADSTDGAPSWDRVRYILDELRNPTVLFMTLVLFLFIFIWQTFSAFYPTYLIEEKRLSTAIAGLLFGLFFAFGVVFKPLTGWAYDRIGMRHSLILVLVGPAVGLAILPRVSGFWPLVGITVLISTMLGTGATTQSYLTETFADDIRGTGLGVVRTISASLGALGPVVFGVVADRGYFNEGYLGLAVIMVVVILLTYRMPEA